MRSFWAAPFLLMRQPAANSGHAPVTHARAHPIAPRLRRPCQPHAARCGLLRAACLLSQIDLGLHEHFPACKLLDTCLRFERGLSGLRGSKWWSSELHSSEGFKAGGRSSLVLPVPMIPQLSKRRPAVPSCPGLFAPDCSPRNMGIRRAPLLWPPGKESH